LFPYRRHTTSRIAFQIQLDVGEDSRRVTVKMNKRLRVEIKHPLASLAEGGTLSKLDE
jgi:hypothetical protein